MRTDEPINIDDKITDKAWAAAPVIGPFVNNQDGSPSPIQTQAKRFYNDKFIYFGFPSADEKIWATKTRRDGHLWAQEVVELFVQANPGHPGYIELEVNPLGTLFDAYLLDIRKPLHYESWNSEKIPRALRVDGTVDGKPGGKDWTCRIALPPEDVVTAPHIPPQPGDRWRVNLYRIDRLPVTAALAWSPAGRDFHVPSMFGQLIFSDRRAR